MRGAAAGGGASGGGPAHTRSTSLATRLKGATAAAATPLPRPSGRGASGQPVARGGAAAGRGLSSRQRRGGRQSGAAPHPPRAGGGRGSDSGAGCRCGSGGRTPLLFPPRARPPRRRRLPIPRRPYPRHRECEGTWGGVADPPSPPPPLLQSRPSRHTSWPVERRHKAATHAPPRRRVCPWRRCVDVGEEGRRGATARPKFERFPLRPTRVVDLSAP